MKHYRHMILGIAVVSFFLWRYIDLQNGLLALRRTLPALADEVKALQEENQRLAYVVAEAESPQHLLELAKRPEYGHLRFPQQTEVFVLEDGVLQKYGF